MKSSKTFLTAAGAAILAISAMTGVAGAQSAPAAKPKLAAKTGKLAEGVKSGTIASTDGNTLTLTTKKGETPATFKLDSSTIKSGNLAAGSRVTVHYKMTDGDKIAVRITASGGKSSALSSSVPKPAKK
jgi:hypothetical protein